MKKITPKEAIKILHPDTSRDALWKIEYYAGFNAEKARLKAVEDACVVACEALEKQIPKKPVHIGGDGIRYTDLYRCPNCGQGFTGTGIADYCYHCGQKLDWSE